MTLAVVVACEDSFYIIADTRTQDIKKKTYTDNTKKVFYSIKHKLGVCIAGNAFIYHPNLPSTLENSFSVSYLMEEFFKFIDSKEIPDVRDKIKSVEDFLKIINKFVFDKLGKNEYYLQAFCKNVSLFLACFIDGRTVIGRHYDKECLQYQNCQNAWETFDYQTDFQNKVCVFSNYYNQIDNCLIQDVQNYENDENSPLKGIKSGFHKENLVVGWNEHFITHDLFIVYKFVISQEPNSIGEYFEYVKVNNNSSSCTKLKFKALEDKLSIINDKAYFPQYIIVKTEEEYARKTESRDIREYDEFGGTYVSIAATL